MLHATREKALKKIFDYKTITFFGRAFQLFRLIFDFQKIVVNLAFPTTLISKISLGYSRFVRHYSGNRFYFLFLQVLRCFSSPGSLFFRIDSEKSY